jgi:hypothetical protein
LEKTWKASKEHIAMDLEKQTKIVLGHGGFISNQLNEKKKQIQASSKK